MYICTVQIQIRTACMALKELIVNNKQCLSSVVYIHLEYLSMYTYVCTMKEDYIIQRTDCKKTVLISTLYLTNGA